MHDNDPKRDPKVGNVITLDDGSTITVTRVYAYNGRQNRVASRWDYAFEGEARFEDRDWSLGGWRRYFDAVRS